MATHKWRDLMAKMPAERRARIEADVNERLRDTIAMGLAELRKNGGMTQAELAEAADMTQSELSKAERRDDHLVSTLRRVVHALGGKLRVTAVFGDREIELDGV